MELLDLYSRASEWTVSKVKGAVDDLDATTPCDQWDVRTLLNHMLDTSQYFTSSALGEDAAPPSPDPPDLLGRDPVKQFEEARAKTLDVFGRDGVIEKTGISLGVATSDMLIHGWDVAKATGQDATMPEGLPAAVYELIHGRFTDEQRKGIFKPAVPVGQNASAQDTLLGYTGRDPNA
jgi:uncharacterized protein (TIGR03086 family)